MSYDSAVVGLISDGVVRTYWPLDDAAASTTAHDEGPLAGALATPTAQCTLGVSGGPVAGLATFMQTNGVGGSGGAARSVSSGAGIDLLTDEFTYLTYARLDSLPSSGTPELIGRTGLQAGVRILTNGNLRAGATPSVAIPSGDRTQIQTQFVAPTAVWMLLGLTYSVKQGLFLLWLNGEIVDEIQVVSGRAASANAFQLGGAGFAASFSGALIANRAFGQSLQHDLMVEAGVGAQTVTGTQPPDRDFGDAGLTVRSEAMHGGHINTAKDGYVVLTDGRQYRGDGWRAQIASKPRAFKSGSETPREIGDQAQKVALDTAMRRLPKALAAKTDFWNGDGLSGPPSAMPRQVMNIARALAVVHARARLSTRRSLPYAWVKVLMDKQVERQQSVDAGAVGVWWGFRTDSAYGSDSAGAFFAVSQWADVLLLLRNHIPSATFQAWLAALDKQLESVDSLTAYASNARGSDHFWYTNGNFELSAASGLYKRWALDGFSVASPWKRRYERQWSILTTGVDPDSATPIACPIGANAQSLGYGFKSAGSPHGAPTWATNGITSATVTGVAPTKPDGSDGVGWLTEQSKSTPGLDWNYSMVQMAEIIGLHHVSRDIEHLKVLHCILGACLPRIGTGQAGVGGAGVGTWNIDCNGGSRQGLNNNGSGTQRTQPWTPPATSYLTWTGLQGDRDLSALDDREHFRQVRINADANSQNVSNPNYWGLAGTMADFALIDTSWDPYA